MIVPTDGRGPWLQFLCRACGLIYDEAVGDEDSGLPPGTRFADISDDWVCPLCGVTKADFEPYAPQRRAPAAISAMPAQRGAGIVIVGAGLAGWSTAAAIRALDGSVPVTLLTACAGDVYNKPELSVALARGISPDTLRRETGAAAAERLGIHLRPDTVAVSLQPARHLLRTSRGPLPYTSLVLASGSRPAVLPGLPADLCWRINNLSAWAGLHWVLASGPRSVAIVGAGMVGCELAEDLARAGHRVTLLSATAQPLQPLLPVPAARRLAGNLASLGIEFRGDTVVTNVVRTGPETLDVHMADGKTLAVGVVVSAVGLVTEDRMVRSAGLEFRHGIVVDPATLRTSAPDVYALGDCASIGGVACRFIEPIARQAEAIAHDLLGRTHAGYVHAAPVIRLKTRSTPLVIRGIPTPGGDWRTLEDTAERLRMEQWDGGVLQARLAA